MVDRGDAESAVRDGESNRLRLSGEGLDDLGVLHDFFDRLGREAGWPDKLTMDLLLCCEELLTNTITYGYPDDQPPGTRFIEAAVTSGPGSVTIELTDNATPYNPLMQPAPDLTLDLEHRPIGGLGIYFVKRIMDELHYEPVAPGPGNRLILRKYIETTSGGTRT